MLRFATGTVRYDVPNRHPGGDRNGYPAQEADVIIDGAGLRTDIARLVAWPGDATAALVARVVGPLVIVNNDSGPDHTAMLSIDPDGTAVWDARDDELAEASINTFIHARLVKDFAKTLNPTLAWLDGQQIATVNIDDTCNAFSDGNTINFFTSSSECANTGQLADVVYHEFGHSLHANSIIPGVGSFDSAFSEGLSDYLAATFTDDPAMGRGFFKSSGPLRHIDPANSEAVWPRDISGAHTTGLIFSGAMWDLRKLLIQQYGETEGIDRADRLFYAAVQRSANIPATYIEVLAEDDDDGDLSNGTPNGCDINAAFGSHGLRTVSAELAPLGAESPRAEGHEISLRITGLLAGCPGDGIAAANLRWQLREDMGTGDELVMSVSETDADTYLGTIPPAANPGDVVNFTIRVLRRRGRDTLLH
jgi:hypothetical protein